MPPRKKVLAWPKEVKEWLDSALIGNNFSRYQELCDELTARGYQISKSALAEYGSDFQHKLEAVKLATDQAKAFIEASPDDEGALDAGLVRMLQTELFTILREMKGVDRKNVNLASITKAVAQLVRASMEQKKHARQAREQALRDAADAVGNAARAQGMDEAQVEFWRAKVLGVG
ncbi:DUF3486 family protein [Lysobacter sp. CA196]|uniref:DUF3486 family protein n=1 Tax=Lysobacter sp. CA196 TaxID=3455606 RepID=UPI003F8D3C80